MSHNAFITPPDLFDAVENFVQEYPEIAQAMELFDITTEQYTIAIQALSGQAATILTTTDATSEQPDADLAKSTE